MQSPATPSPLTDLLARHGYPSVNAFARKFGLDRRMNRSFIGTRRPTIAVIRVIAEKLELTVQECAAALNFDPFA